MVAIINPFDSGGYTLAEMTEAINILPNVYTRLGEMGLFRFEGITQGSAIIEQAEGVLNLLPTVPLGGPATVANRDTRSMRSFTIPWIPHDDAITPQDVQGVRGFGVADAVDPLATVMERKLTRMRVKHAQTLSTGATETLVPAGEGVALPLATLDTFVTYGSPANLIETVNTMGLPMYARQLARPDGSAIEVKTEASILPVNKRPRLAVRIFSSN